MATLVPIHPFRAWRKSKGYSLEHASALIEARGFSFKPRSVLAVEDGWRRFAYDVCEAIEAITDGEVKVSQLRHWPMRLAKKVCSKKRAA